MTAWISIRIIFKWCVESKKENMSGELHAQLFKRKKCRQLEHEIKCAKRPNNEGDGKKLSKNGRKRKKKESGFKACLSPPALQGGFHWRFIYN